ncbi:hypothetical protein WISP_52721 [Willisornis vidua]|uniref:Endonuclease/exonuclease/phosphatase domain-containing protein n=1 Tax=Willisornis vidua TaxID=1566151 RepID=A0ABQ9DIX9_9PASS|nr:hypothetical protein WISP_52721 [Willisornis vidua]
MIINGLPKVEAQGFLNTIDIPNDPAALLSLWDPGGLVMLGHSNRIISLHLPLHIKQHVVLFTMYAPTLQTHPVEKDKFYTDLRCLTQKVPADDKIIIPGDFNARVGENSETWKGLLGKHGIGNCNDNGCLLLEFCAEHQLTITNTIFQQKHSLKKTWMHP